MAEDPQTTVAWRCHLAGPIGADLDAWLEAVPVHLSEQLEAASFRVVEWLTTRASKVAEKEVDATGRPKDDDVVAVTFGDVVEERFTLKSLADAKDAKGRERLTSRLNGRTLLVDRRLGGLSDEGLLDGKADAPVAVLDDPEVPWPDVLYRVRRVTTDSPDAPSDWRERLRVPLAMDADEEVTSWLVVEKRRQDAATEEDRSSGRLQSLVEHQQWARDEAQRMVDALGAQLPDDARAAVVVAAALHDEGKQAARWQRAFSAPRVGGPYAKTKGPMRVSVLDGYRHELGSLPWMERSEEFRALSPDARDLALHLVAAHHGFARPVIETRGCDDAPPSIIEERAREVALRFLRLQRRWGPWRLAWLEALVRAADQTASRLNDEQES